MEHDINRNWGVSQQFIPISCNKQNNMYPLMIFSVINGPFAMKMLSPSLLL